MATNTVALENLGALRDGVSSSLEAMDGALDLLKPVARGLEITPVGGEGLRAFNLAASALPQALNLTTAPLKSAFDIVTAGTPADIFVKLHPELEEAMQDPAFAGALNDAMIKDDTMLPGLLRMSSSEGGSEVLAKFAESLKNPESRGIATQILQRVADSPDLKFGQLEEVVNSLTQFDPSKPEESRQRAHEAFEAVGATAEDADRIIEQGTQDFWKDILNHPERLGGMVGNFFAQIGLPQEWCEYIAGIATKFVQGVEGFPEFAKSWVWDGNEELQRFTEEHIRPGLADVRETGVNALNYTM